MPLALNLIALVDLAVAIGRQIHNAHIYPEHAIHVTRFRLLNLAGCQHIPFAAMIEQVAFALPGCQHAALPLTTKCDSVKKLKPLKRGRSSRR